MAAEHPLESRVVEARHLIRGSQVRGREPVDYLADTQESYSLIQMPSQPTHQASRALSCRPADDANDAGRVPAKQKRTRRRKPKPEPDEGTKMQKRKEYLEKNKQAAQRCREKKKLAQNDLVHEAEGLKERNDKLQSDLERLCHEMARVKNFLLQLRGCPCEHHSNDEDMLGRFASLEKDFEQHEKHRAQISAEYERKRHENSMPKRMQGMHLQEALPEFTGATPMGMHLQTDLPDFTDAPQINEAEDAYTQGYSYQSQPHSPTRGEAGDSIGSFETELQGRASLDDEFQQSLLQSLSFSALRERVAGLHFTELQPALVLISSPSSDKSESLISASAPTPADDSMRSQVTGIATNPQDSFPLWVDDFDVPVLDASDPLFHDFDLLDGMGAVNDMGFSDPPKAQMDSPKSALAIDDSTYGPLITTR